MPKTYDSASFLEVVRNVVTTYKGTVGDPNTIVDVSKIARVEPITLISNNLSATKELYPIMHGVLNVYAGYYLQAVSILSSQLTDVRILKILDKLNPDRDIKTVLTSATIGTESLSTTYSTLVSLEDKGYGFNFSIEYKPVLDDETLSVQAKKLDTFEKMGAAVGKVLNVEFKVIDDSGKENIITIPIVVKLDNMIIPSDVIDQILLSNKDEITMSSRFKDVLAGKISFIKDFLLADDLIQKQKKTMLKDPTGYYTQVMKRISNSRIFSAMTGNISLAGISSIIVISNEDEEVIQKSLGGALTNTETREIIFNNTSAMMIVVIDKEWERVSMYIRNIDGFTQNSFDDFKVTVEKGSNITDILKAFSLNNAPTF